MENMQIQNSLIDGALKSGVEKFIFLGSSCIYPKKSIQPMKEEYLMNGSLEPTNEGYALSKITALKLCKYYNEQYGTKFISLMPPNLYGIYEKFDLNHSHVISALIMRFHQAKVNNDKNISIWGSGNARREFLFAEELAQGLLFSMNNIK